MGNSFLAALLKRRVPSLITIGFRIRNRVRCVCLLYIAFGLVCIWLGRSPGESGNLGTPLREVSCRIRTRRIHTIIVATLRVPATSQPVWTRPPFPQSVRVAIRQVTCGQATALVAKPNRTFLIIWVLLTHPTYLAGVIATISILHTRGIALTGRIEYKLITTAHT